MGNQRTLQQLAPERRRGVVLRVRAGEEVSVRVYLRQMMAQPLYTSFVPAGQPWTLSHLDGPAETLAVSPWAQVAIQSGGSMWGPYAAFLKHVCTFERWVEDSRFFIGDSEGVIHEVAMIAGRAYVTSFHEGAWRDLDAVLMDYGIPPLPE